MKHKMGPQTNNIQSNLNSPILTNEQLGIAPNIQQSKLNKKNPLFLIGCIGIGLLLVITLIISGGIRAKKTGSGKTEDLIQFMKLYQYGDPAYKKDINLNLPAQQSYAYSKLTGTDNSINKAKYGESFYEAYTKYAAQNETAELVFLYKNLIQVGENTKDLRESYLKNNEESARKIIEKITKDFSSVKNKQANEGLQRIKNYYDGELRYLQELQKMGCINEQEITYDCEVKVYQEPSNHTEAYNAANIVISNEKQNSKESEELIKNINNLINEDYKIKAMNKDSKNEKKK